MRPEWTLLALDDRRAIYDFIEADNPLAAARLDEQFTEKVTTLLKFPALGQEGRHENTRELMVHRNYVVVYDVVDEVIRILRVLHAARQWP